MKQERRNRVAKIHLPDRGPKIFRKLEVYYDEGGISMWTYKKKERGYYLTSRVAEIDNGCETWTPGQAGDGYIFLEGASRFNRKRLDQLSENAKKYSEQINIMLEKPVDGAVDYIQHVTLQGYEVTPV